MATFLRIALISILECTPTIAQTVPLMFDPMDESIKLLNRPAADISVQAKVAILTGTAALQVKFDKMTISVSVVVFSLCLCPITVTITKLWFVKPNLVIRVVYKHVVDI